LEGRVELWVKLKVTDLVVETSWFTLMEKLDFAGTVFGLSRYSCWFISVSAPDIGTALEELEGAVTIDSAFINQNKHRYSLVPEGKEAGEDTPGRGDFDHRKDFVLRESSPEGTRLERLPAFDLYACDCLVRTDGSGSDYTGRLKTRLDKVSIRDLEYGQVWRIIGKADSREEAYEMVEKIAVTRSRRQGLLLNPHYQSHEIIGIEKIPGAGEGK
jgi:hypothetical protein